MEIVKFEDIEHLSNCDYMHTKNQTCLLEESDAQCGYVFYNERTRLLKFYCTYCQETYDNIDYFCEHLGDHVNELIEEIYEEESQIVRKEGIDKYEITENDNSQNMSFIVLKDNYKQKENTLSSLQSSDEDMRDAKEQFVNTSSNDEMFIEEIENGEDIPTELGKKIDAVADSKFVVDNNFSKKMNNCTENKIHATTVSKAIAPPDDPKTGNSFEDCFIKETNIDKIRSEGVCVLREKNFGESRRIQKKRSNIQDLLRLKRRRKKITTVKVIAVKNRIAELYERIQNEQQKSQQFYSTDFVNANQGQERQDTIKCLIQDDIGKQNKIKMISNPTDLDDKNNQAAIAFSRKVIGETLITLIPEGTKIPNKLPSPYNTLTNKDCVKNDQLAIENTSRYKHYKIEGKQEKKAVCPACGKIFRSHFSLTIHKRIHYLESDSSVKLAHKCSDCDQLFNKLSQLKYHVESVHYPEGFICKICNRQLSSLSLLERHMVKIHLDRPFNCKKCNKNFSDSLTFEEHLASHNSDEVFKCTTCGRKYRTEFFLLEHMRNHKEQVPQTCVVCGKVTLRITQHMKIHTPRPKRLLSCSECGKVFNFSSGLSHHFRIMHKLPKPSPKPKKEPHAYKRKRRPYTNDPGINRKKQLSNSADSTFIIDNDTFRDQIIAEQINIPYKVYDTVPHATIINVDKNETRYIKQTNTDSSSQKYLSNNQAIIQNFHLDALNHKEEEAKRVIVELIQNSTFNTFFPDNFSSVLEITPPIAREETISAVNSIVHDC